MLVGRRQSQDLASPGCVARSRMHEAEEQAPCFPFFLPGFQTPNSSFDPAGEESARGRPACVPGRGYDTGASVRDSAFAPLTGLRAGKPLARPQNGPVQPPLLPSSCDDSGLHQPGREEVGLRVTPLTSSVLPCQGELTDLRMSIHMSVHPRAHQ